MRVAAKSKQMRQVVAPAGVVPNPLGRRGRKKRETRERILEMARGLFMTKGYNGTTVEEIAEAAEVSRATFFNYFPVKPLLLSEMVEGMMEHFESRVAKQLRHPATMTGRLRDFFHYSLQVIERDRDMARLALIESFSGRANPSVQPERLRRMHRSLEALLRDGIERGDVRTDFSLPLLVAMVAGAHNQIVLAWLSDPKYPLGERLHEAARLLGESLSPPNSHPYRRSPKGESRRT